MYLITWIVSLLYLTHYLYQTPFVKRTRGIRIRPMGDIFVVHFKERKGRISLGVRWTVYRTGLEYPTWFPDSSTRMSPAGCCWSRWPLFRAPCDVHGAMLSSPHRLGSWPYTARDYRKRAIPALQNHPRPDTLIWVLQPFNTSWSLANAETHRQSALLSDG